MPKPIVYHVKIKISVDIPHKNSHNTSESSILKILCVIVEDYIGKIHQLLLLKLQSKGISTL